MIGRILRPLANHFGYQLATELPCFLNGECSRAGLTPEMALAFAEFKLNQVFVLQIGANDGLRNDYLSPFLDRPNWSGVLVEADPRLYSRLVQNNDHRKDRIRCLNTAIGDGSAMPFYSVDMALADGMPAWVEGLGGFVESHIHKHAKDVPGLSDCIVTRMLPTVTPVDLIGSETGRAPDVVVTDCEGFDSHIIEMYDFLRFRPSVYIFESRHITRGKLDSIFRLFSEHGYALAWGGQDSVAIHASLLGR